MVQVLETLHHFPEHGSVWGSILRAKKLTSSRIFNHKLHEWPQRRDGVVDVNVGADFTHLTDI